MIAIVTLKKVLAGKSMRDDGNIGLRAFEAAALPHLNDLFRTSARLLGDRTEAEDIVQETYVLAWKSFEDLESETDCRAWLFRIMFNAIGHYRRKWFDRKTTRDTDEVLDDTLAYAPAVPGHLSDEEVLAALGAIPEYLRAVILLADVEGFSYTKVAEILKVPVGTVMSRLSQSRGLLRNALVDLARPYAISKRCPEGSVRA
jgi:RNA polymerase sigma-70 factor, ECF subfamily